MIIIVIVVVILAVLGTVSMIAYQTTAEDNEREQDVATIQRSLESYYLKGNARVALTDTKGSYPTVGEVSHIFGTATCPNTDYTTCDTTNYSADALPGLSANALTSPGQATDQTTLTTTASGSVSTLIASGRYIYKPLTRATASNNGADTTGQCTILGACSSYLIFYKAADGSTISVGSQRK